MARQPQQKPSTQIKYYPFNGGLDLVTPALSVDPGFALAMEAYEPWYNGGYRRVDGYERFDGRAKPSAAMQYGIAMSSLTGVTIGTAMGTTTINPALAGTGVTSGATGQFVQGVAVGAPTTSPTRRPSGPFFLARISISALPPPRALS